MLNPRPEEVYEERRAAMVASVQPEINDMVGGLEKVVRTKAWEDIRKGELTPDKAMAYLLELYSYDQLRRQVDKQVTKVRAKHPAERRP